MLIVPCIIKGCKVKHPRAIYVCSLSNAASRPLRLVFWIFYTVHVYVCLHACMHAGKASLCILLFEEASPYLMNIK
jgi:hypothetical protein